MKSKPRASLLLTLATVLIVAGIALRLCFSPPEIGVPVWVAERSAPPVVVPPIADDDPMRVDVGPAVLPTEDLAKALIVAKPKVRFEATTDLAVALSKTVAEEMMAAISPSLEGSLKSQASGHATSVTRCYMFLFSVLPDFAKLMGQGDITADVVCRPRVMREGGMNHWESVPSTKLVHFHIDTPSYVVTLTFKRPASNPELFDSLFTVN